MTDQCIIDHALLRQNILFIAVDKKNYRVDGDVSFAFISNAELMSHDTTVQIKDTEFFRNADEF